MNESLLISTSNRNLERKLKIFGFEVFDLLILAMVLSGLNLFLKGIQLQTPIVWGGTLLFGGVLYFSKKNKPENFLLFKLRFWLRPASYFANAFDLDQLPYMRKPHDAE